MRKAGFSPIKSVVKDAVPYLVNREHRSFHGGGLSMGAFTVRSFSDPDEAGAFASYVINDYPAGAITNEAHFHQQHNALHSDGVASCQGIITAHVCEKGFYDFLIAVGVDQLPNGSGDGIGLEDGYSRDGAELITDLVFNEMILPGSNGPIMKTSVVPGDIIFFNQNWLHAIRGNGNDRESLAIYPV